jgi:serine/threonine protein phosphatase 1
MKDNGKIICIGDIHGELYKLHNLFERLSFTEKDTIIFLGDYIDRGENSKGVIDFVLSLKDKCNLVTLKGNHEMFAIDTFDFIEGKFSKGGMFNSWVMNGGSACLKSYGKEDVKENILEMVDIHEDFFKNLQLTYETENHIFVHGFLAHEQDVEDQEEWQCLWGRYGDIWPHKSGKTVVCGHSIQRNGVKNEGFKICIDTGSFLPDGYITAMVIDGAKEYFVDSR